MPHKQVVLLLALALLIAAIAGGAAAAANDDGEAPASDSAPAAEAVETPDDADGPDDADVPITGPDLERASAAALAYLGEGRVTETEVGDEESYYEVEVTLPDGRQIDVQLDEAFNVVGTD